MISARKVAYFSRIFPKPLPDLCTLPRVAYKMVAYKKNDVYAVP